MRFTGGEARGRGIKGPRGGGLRPTSDRVREAIFDILGGRVPGARFLDAFAGTGAVGLEALSRGAARAVFLERDRRALRLIRENLDLAPWAGSFAIIEGDAQAQRTFISRWQPRVPLVTNARHRKMLELILGEMDEHLRVFQQALEGRTDLLGPHADGKELSGEVLPGRPRG